MIKPSSDTPNNAIEFAKLADKVGIPKGVFNIVTGRGGTVGDELASNEKIGLVSLTGSVNAGVSVMKAAAQNVTKVSLELCGKAPAIVAEDADIGLAVKAIVNSRIINTGQVCNCAERVYVHESIADTFIKKIVTSMKNVKCGNPLEDEGLDMRPLTNKQAIESIEAMVNRAVEEGAQVLTGGKRADVTPGYYYEPTVLVNVKKIQKLYKNKYLDRFFQL